MDVSFFKQRPYYPKSDIQRVSFTQEYQLWDIDLSETLHDSHMSHVVHSYPEPEMSLVVQSYPELEIIVQLEPLNPESNPCSNDSTPQCPISTLLTEKKDELHVYHRRNKTQGGEQ